MEDKIKQAVIDGVNEAKKPLEEKLAKSEEVIKSLSEKVEKLEKAPAPRQQAPAIVGSKMFKGYNLNKQGKFIKEQGSKLKTHLETLHSEESQEELTKFFINLNLAFKGDFEARKELREMASKAAYTEGTANQGGYLVPDEYAMDLILLSRDMTWALTECNVISMGSDTLRIPKESTLPSVAWKSEAAAFTESEGTFGELALTANKLTAWSIASNEMLNDCLYWRNSSAMGWLWNLITKS